MSAAAPAKMHSPAALAQAGRLGLRLGPPNLEVFARQLEILARANPRILAVTSDSRGSGKLGPFGRDLPDRLIEVGIAEQNLVGMAAGLSSAGRVVFAVSPASFLTARAFEQIKNDVAYSAHPVVLVGISAGVSYGALGSTHHSLHDLAALRTIPSLSILVPADAAETEAAVSAASAAAAPVYLRLGKAPLYRLPGEPPRSLEQARVVRPGRRGAFLATGETVVHALLAAASLAETDGLDCRVVSLPSVKPLDTQAVRQAARECGAVITVEEHSVHGGLGEACAAVIATAGIGCRFAIAGIPDEDTVTGSQADIFRHYGLTMEGLAERLRALMK